MVSILKLRWVFHVSSIFYFWNNCRFRRNVVIFIILRYTFFMEFIFLKLWKWINFINNVNTRRSITSGSDANFSHVQSKKNITKNSDLLLYIVSPLLKEMLIFKLNIDKANTLINYQELPLAIKNFGKLIMLRLSYSSN